MSERQGEKTRQRNSILVRGESYRRGGKTVSRGGLGNELSPRVCVQCLEVQSLHEPATRIVFQGRG